MFMEVLNGYNQNGELASGLAKQTAENTRQAVKGLVRSLNPNDTTGATDADTHDLINARNAFQDMAEKVTKIENKEPRRKLRGSLF